MIPFFLLIHVLVAFLLIVLVLLQQGKGADMGASFGGGASQTLFGSQGASSFLSRLTAISVTVFFMTSLTLTYLQHQKTRQLTSPGFQSAATEEVPPELAIPES
jgi:preprotein translocase subunit SecG